MRLAPEAVCICRKLVFEEILHFFGAELTAAGHAIETHLPVKVHSAITALWAGYIFVFWFKHRQSHGGMFLLLGTNVRVSDSTSLVSSNLFLSRRSKLSSCIISSIESSSWSQRARISRMPSARRSSSLEFVVLATNFRKPSALTALRPPRTRFLICFKYP